MKDIKASKSIDTGNPYEIVPESDNLRKFSDELINKFKGKMIEVFLGEQSETLNFDDFSVPQNCSIFGKLVEVLDRFIILDCYYFDHAAKRLKSGCIIYINAFQIRAMAEVNNRGSLSDVFLHVNDAKTVRKLILQNK